MIARQSWYNEPDPYQLFPLKHMLVFVGGTASYITNFVVIVYIYGMQPQLGDKSWTWSCSWNIRTVMLFGFWPYLVSIYINLVYFELLHAFSF